ncbi:MAG TPA: lysophospholipid acyltransferase family protein [Bacilli bacterium]
MFKLLIASIYLFFYMLFTIPQLVRVKRWQKQKQFHKIDRLVSKMAGKFGRSFVRVTGSRVSVSGAEQIPADEAVLFVCNHQSLYDILLLLGYIPKAKGFIAKKELAKMPLISTWMRYLPSVFMDRKNVRQSLTAINQGIAALKSGHSLVVFPEGTRSRDGKLLDFKPGSLKLAIKSGVPIVPITIKGSGEIFGWSGWRLKRADAELIVSPPLYADEYQAMDIHALSSRVRDLIAANL